MKGLNLQNFKKVHDSEHSAIFESDGGHKITVAKSALSPKLREQLHALPIHAKDGGKIPDYLEPNSPTPAFDAGPMVEQAMAGQNLPTQEEYFNQRVQHQMMGDPRARAPFTVEEQKSKAEQDVMNKMELEKEASQVQSQIDAEKIAATNQQRARLGLPQIPGAQPQQSFMPSNISQAQPDQMQQAMQSGGAHSLQSAVNMGHQAIKAQEAADIARGQQEKAVLDQAAKDQQYINDQAQKSYSAFMQERQNLMRDMQEHPIIANHFLDSMGGGQKFATAIGLILGGMGAGITGGENPALKFLNQQIDRDINAQLQNLDKKKGLLHANAQTLNDIHNGAAMMRANLNDFVSLKLKEAAANTSDQAAKARALGAASDLDLKTHDLLLQASMRQAALGGASQGAVDPARLVPMLVPQHHQAKVFGEIEAAQNTRKLESQILAAFDKAAKFTHVKDIVPGVQNADQKALQVLMGPTFKDVEGTVRQAAMDLMNSKTTPSPYDSKAEIATKRNALIGYLHSKMSAPTAKGYGIDLDKYQSTSTNPVMQMTPQQQQWAQWAKQNPNNPTAQAFMKKMGMQ